MTKYILHGGATSRESEDNRNFFLEMIKGLSGTVNILCVYYARKDKDKWAFDLENDKQKFSKVVTDQTLNFEIADEDTNIFIEQIKKADVIYMRGGESTHLLQEYLEKVDNLENLWKGKVVAGSSAGAIVLAKYYYENGHEERPYNKGLGILPIKAFSHYTDGESDKLEKLKEFGENIETIYKIPEEKFFVIEQ